MSITRGGDGETSRAKALPVSALVGPALIQYMARLISSYTIIAGQVASASKGTRLEYLYLSKGIHGLMSLA